MLSKIWNHGLPQKGKNVMPNRDTGRGLQCTCGRYWPGLLGENIWRSIISVMETFHCSPLDGVWSSSNSNTCWHLLSTYVSSTAVNIVHVLTHVIPTVPYKVGAITIPILLMGKMSHRESKRCTQFHRANKGQRRSSNPGNVSPEPELGTATPAALVHGRLRTRHIGGLFL